MMEILFSVTWFYHGHHYYYYNSCVYVFKLFVFYNLGSNIVTPPTTVVGYILSIMMM